MDTHETTSPTGGHPAPGRRPARRRAVIAAGVAVGALGTAVPAHAATFEVNSLADPNGVDACDTSCTFRDAVEAADSAPGADKITFQSGLSGTIALGGNTIAGSDDDLDIQGPGASVLALQAADGSDAFETQGTGTVTIGGLTITGGSGGVGGNVLAFADNTVIHDAVISDGTAQVAGGVFAVGAVTIERSTLTDNAAQMIGGAISSYPGGPGVRVVDSVVSGNTAGSYGGGIAFKYGTPDDAASLEGSTVSGNDAPMGAGLSIMALPAGEPLAITGSTVSGNTAPTGAGIQIGSEDPVFGADGSFSARNATVAGNTADTAGGGVELASFDDGDGGRAVSAVDLDSTLIGGNAPEDLHAGADSTAGGFTASYSLVQAPGDAPLSAGVAGSNLLGVAPALGALADNGGLTETLLPAADSPAVDAGRANTLTLDQRGLPRTVDRSNANAAGGDGTDIGAVELPGEPAASAPTPSASAPQAPPVTAPAPAPSPAATVPRKAKATILFASSRARLSTASKRVLAKLARGRTSAKRLTCVGFTASANGKSNYRRALGLRRARTTCRFLAKRLKIDKVVVRSKAGARPVASNKTLLGRARNRRVEVTLESR